MKQNKWNEIKYTKLKSILIDKTDNINNSL